MENRRRAAARPQGLGALMANLKSLPRYLRTSLFGQVVPASDRERSLAIFSSLFLHIHPTRVHVRSLRFTSTLAMGMASFFLFVILVVTGVLLMVYYKPSVELAYDSMKDIHYVVPMGRLVRNIHRWAAHLMVVTVMVHMCRVFYTASYKRPREFNWLIGVTLFVLTLALSFTGYLLPWDQLGFWAAAIGSHIAGSPRELTDALGITSFFDPGSMIRQIMLGAKQVGQEALLRFYVLHVIVLPGVMAALLGVHFWRIRKDGGLGRPEAATSAGKGAPPTGAPPARPAEAPSKTHGLMCVVRDRKPATNLDPADTVPSWPYLLRVELLIFMAILLVCVVLGLAFDAPLLAPANPALPENPAKAPWYFLGIQEMVSYAAFMGGVGIPTLVLLALALIPYLDREREDAGVYVSGRQGMKTLLHSVLFAAVMSVLAVAFPVKFGWLRNWFPAIPQLVVIFINPGSLLAGACALWSLFVLKRTGSTRMSALALFTCFIVGFVILTYVGTFLRGPNWGFYWSRASWPVH